MKAIKVNFNNEQEEKVLLSILDSLNYDYEPQYSSNDELLISQALERSNLDHEKGQTSNHEEVIGRIKDKYDL